MKCALHRTTLPWWLPVFGLGLLGASACRAPRADASPRSEHRADELRAPTRDDARAAAATRPEFATGFRSLVVLDPARTYRTAWDGGATYGGAEGRARPLLVNLWYPTSAPREDDRLVHADYFDLVAEDGDVAAFCDALAAHALEIATAQVLGDAPRPSAVDAWLGSPRDAYRDAPPAAGRFPVVVVHSGAGSSYEDEAALCEALARDGYVVVGSAYQDASGESLDVDGAQGSADDLARLVSFAAELPFADAGRVALVGHSLGAQAALRAVARGAVDVDAVVLLDSTVDYYTLTIPTFARVVEEVSEGRARVDESLLVAAGVQASFELVDRLEAAERRYLAVGTLDHDEFVEQGIERIRHGLLATPTGGDASERRRAELAVELHARLIDYVRAFLDAELRGEPARLDDLDAALVDAPLAETGMHLTLAPRGVTGPPAVDPLASVAPTPRQWLRFAREHPVDETLALLARHADAPGPIPSRASMLAGSIVWDRFEANDAEGARRIHEHLLAMGCDTTRLLGFLATMGELLGRPQLARLYLDRALLLAPDDEALAKRLAAIDDGAGEAATGGQR